MYNARHDRAGVRFNMINPETGNRIKMVTKDSETGQELQRSSLVKGYEFSKGRYVLLSEADLDSVKVESSAIMAVEKFIEAGSIDPIYFDESYYLAPDARAGEDVYAVLRDAIAQTGTIALTRVVISQRERTVALRHAGPGIIAHTLLEERDLNQARQYFDEAAKLPVDPEMVDLATQLIKRQTGKYDPADLVDRYEDRLRAMLDAKIAGLPPPEEQVYERGNVVDLVTAFRRSLEETKAEEAPTERPPKAPRQKKGPPQPAGKATRKRA
jgi:DNA end-binding protein Ku